MGAVALPLPDVEQFIEQAQGVARIAQLIGELVLLGRCPHVQRGKNHERHAQQQQRERKGAEPGAICGVGGASCQRLQPSETRSAPRRMQSSTATRVAVDPSGQRRLDPFKRLYGRESAPIIGAARRPPRMDVFKFARGLSKSCQVGCVPGSAFPESNMLLYLSRASFWLAALAAAWALVAPGQHEPR